MRIPGILKFFIIFVIVLVILAGVLVGGTALFVKFYGKTMLEGFLSDRLEMKVKFKAVSFDVQKYTVSLRDLALAEPGIATHAFFKAGKVTVALDGEQLKKDRKIFVDRIDVTGAHISIERDKHGRITLARRVSPSVIARSKATKQSPGVAYAQTTPSPIAFYKLARNIRRLVIKDSTVEFKDHEVYEVPYTTRIVGLNADIYRGVLEKLRMTPQQSEVGSIPLACIVSFTLPSDKYGRGEVFAMANVNLYKFMMDVEMIAETKNIDIMQFFPYFSKYTPFSVNEGVFSSRTDFVMRNNYINSYTKMSFRRLSFVVEKGMQNARFLTSTVSQIEPYLTSKGGNVIFDFIITGPTEALKPDFGPIVKSAIGAITQDKMRQVMSAISGLQGAGGLAGLIP